MTSLPLSLCQVPFLLTPEAKSLILQVWTDSYQQLCGGVLQNR